MDATAASLADGSHRDNFLALYSGQFDPASPTVGLISCDDDSSGNRPLWSMFGSNLSGGQVYTMVLTSYLGIHPGNEYFVQGTSTFRVSPAVRVEYSVGGLVSGLAAGNSVVLQNNAGDSLSVSANGPLAFATALADGSTYSVIVLTQPTTPNQTCSVDSGGSGTLAGGHATDARLSCVNGAVAPGAPTNVGAVMTGSQANVTWSAPGSDGGRPITGYAVTLMPGGLSCTVSGVYPGQAYTVSVTASNAAGRSAPGLTPQAWHHGQK